MSLPPGIALAALAPGWSELGIVVSALLGAFTLAGIGVRFVLLPYLKEQLVKPVQETHRQVTDSGDRFHEPTILARLEGVRTELTSMRSSVETVQHVANAARSSADGAHRRLDAHSNWADAEVHRLWSAVRNRQKGT